MEGTDPTPITQKRLIDIIPTSYLTLTLLFLGGVAVIAALEAGYYYMPQIAPKTTDGAVATLDLDDEGSLGTWFSSATLGMASLVGLMVYWVRKQRADDYHGRYRIWLWASLTWLVMSIDEGASLHEGFKELMTLVTGQRIWGDGSLWWAGPYFLVLSVVGIRLLLDMRPAKMPIVTLLLAGVCYAVGVVAQLGLIFPEALAKAIMIEEGAEMAGHLLLLFCMLVSARYMILDAQGLLPERRKRRKKVKAADEDSDEAPARKKKARGEVHKSHPTPPEPEGDHRKDKQSRRQKAQAAKAVVEAEPEPENETDEEQPGRKLTRAERKALRRQRRQQRQAEFDE